jgi:hypothetical protein
MLKGVPYYASGSSTLFLLGSGANEAINLVGNIQPFSQSVDSRLGSVEASLGGGGSIATRVGNLEALTGSYATTGSNRFNGDQTITGSLLVTGPIQGTGSIFLQPDVADGRKLEIYNTAATDVHIKATGGLTFLGDDTNYVLVDNSSQVISITGVNGINFTGSLSASGDISSSTISGIGNVTLFSQSVDSRFSASAAAQTALSSSVATSFSASAASVTSLSASIAITDNAQTDKITKLEASQSNFDDAIILSGSGAGSSVTIQGSLFVQGTTTTVDSTTIQLGDNIIELNGSGAANGGLLVKDVTAPNTVSGSLLWDSTNDYWKAGVLGSEKQLADVDFVSSSISTLSQSVDTRLDTIESSIGTGGSLGTRVSNLETISGSYLAFTQSYYTDSSSFDTRISASVAGYTANSASAATSFSASLASQTALSASVASDFNTLSGSAYTQFSASAASVTANSASSATSFSASLATITANSASAATDFNTLSGSTYTQFSASTATVTANSASAATSFSASIFTATANSASAATDFNTLSGSTFTQFSASAFTATANSASAGTSISASNAQIAALSASVASTTGDFSGSIFTQFSASVFTATANSSSAATSFSASLATISANSASAATDFNTLSGSAFTQFSASAATVTANSASAATSFSASLASQTALSASIATTDNAQTERLGALETYSSSLKTAIELTGSNVTIQGDLLVRGTTTSVNSTTIELGDNIIELNGSGASNGGLYVKDVTSPNLATGSLIWDSTNDYWKAGVKDSEYKVLLATGDNVFTSSIQTALSGTFGYATFDTAISTSFSSSAYQIAQLSSSVASVTGTFSSSVATSFSASAASVTALSSSVDSRLDTLEGSGSIQGVGTSNNVSFSSVTASLNVPGGSSTKRLAFRGLTDNIEFIAAPTTAGDIAQWNGTDFVMSNTIDGGSF